VPAAPRRRACRCRLQVLALTNFWNAYIGPERFLAMAEGSAAGKDIAAFYA
jgi:hypothetical protein